MTRSERILSEALSLPAAERLDMIERLWESLAADPEAVELSDAQRDELDWRIEEMDAAPDTGVSWDDVKCELRNRR